MDEPVCFRYRSCFNVSREELYEWHRRNGALERLIPPWENTSVVSRKGTIDPGGEVIMRMHAGFIPFHWTARHVENTPGREFRDIMHKGPFKSWSHSHIFSDHPGGALLEDKIEYSLPFHRLLPQSITNRVDVTLRRTFQHRKKVLTADLALHKKFGKRKMRVLITGASGVLGRALCPLLTTGGHEVWTLVRRKPDSQKNEIYWNPAKGEIGDLPYFDAVIHLAGEYIGLGRWTDEKKKAVVESRTLGTKLLVDAICGKADSPEVFLCASAVGYYGDTGDVEVTEEHTSGNDFISEVCRVWEQTAEEAQNAGIRTVILRIGVSLSPGGGALQRLLGASALGFFRRFGSGRQYISWISIDDTISAIYHAMCCRTLHGPVNISAPHAVTNTQFMRVLAEVTEKFCTVPVPAALLTVMYGQMAKEILLSGCRASCTKLIESGFVFRHATLHEALTDLLGRFDLEEREEEVFQA